MPKNWWLWTVVVEKTPESLLGSKEIKSINLKRNQSWIFTGRTDTETEAPVFWSSDVNSLLIKKVSDAVKNWRQKEKRASEDEMAGWHHQRIDMHWANFKRGWGTGRPGVLQSMGLQRVGHNWVNEQQQQKTWSVLWFMGWLTTVGLQGGTGFRNVKYIAENQNQLTFLAS